LKNGNIEPDSYAWCIVGLAERGHDHLALDHALLFRIACLDDDRMLGMRVALEFLGGPNAEMRSHLVVFFGLIRTLWPKTLWRTIGPLTDFKRRAMTGLLFDAILDHRTKTQRARLLLAFVELAETNVSLAGYLDEWFRGHFITHEDLRMSDELGEQSSPKTML
jgi:hypothetical protein